MFDGRCAEFYSERRKGRQEGRKREREIQWERRRSDFVFDSVFRHFATEREKRANCDVEEKTKTTENHSHLPRARGHGTGRRVVQDRLLNIDWLAEFRPCGLDCKMTRSVIFFRPSNRRSVLRFQIGLRFRVSTWENLPQDFISPYFRPVFFASHRVPVCRQSVSNKNRLNLTIFIHVSI